MSYHHFSTFERGRIQELLSLGCSHRNIATRLGRHRSCIDREVRRNIIDTSYVAEVAQASYHTRRKVSKPKGKISSALKETIAEKLQLTWSPEQIANTVTLGIVSCKTFGRQSLCTLYKLIILCIPVGLFTTVKQSILLGMVLFQNILYN